MPSRRRTPFLALAAVVVSSTSARADDGRAVAAMQAEVDAYYGGETRQAHIFVGVGAASIVGGGLLATRSGDFSRGLGWSLVGLGALQAIGATFYSFQVSAGQARFAGTLARDPSAFRKEESEHIHGTTSRFVLYRSSELVLAAAGVGVATYGFAARRDLWKGIGIGVAAEAITFFVLDSFGTKAAHDYEDKVRAFEPVASVQVGGGDRPWGACVGGTF